MGLEPSMPDSEVLTALPTALFERLLQVIHECILFMFCISIFEVVLGRPWTLFFKIIVHSSIWRFK